MTRPQPEAARSACELQKRGFAVEIVPFMEIERLSCDQTTINKSDGFILTSQRAAFALPENGLHRPVFTTGDQTAHAARERGFRSVRSASGNWQDLLKLIVASQPLKTKLCHLSGLRQRGELANALKTAGINYQRINAYAMRDLDQPPPALSHFLRLRSPASILFYSPATAAIWQRLHPNATIHQAICLSDACARALDEHAWGRIAVASHPHEEALWDCLETSG